MNQKRLPKVLITIYALLLFASCIPDNFKKHTDVQFSDQHFKTAIALIELHKIRKGKYPDSLDSLKYLGDWDKIIYNTVEYKKLENGYELNLTRGFFSSKPVELRYPKDFYNGLGLKRSNLKD
jgi:hypothetical protein